MGDQTLTQMCLYILSCLLFVFSLSELPSFLKTPMDLTIRTGTMARLECAAEGHPSPQIAWQKDGGTDFPAARERRMHVMPDDDIFFIANVKTEDMGVYSCTAQNAAGSLSANATLTVLGESSTWLGEHIIDVSLLGHFIWVTPLKLVAHLLYICPSLQTLSH